MEPYPGGFAAGAEGGKGARPVLFFLMMHWAVCLYLTVETTLVVVGTI